ncbi:MAG: transcriptional regulator [Thermoplasmata archaeon]|nr:transcriptional regulator [Thermoplasmata archaeon]
MNRIELLLETRNLLARAGFYCSQICNIRPSSFDFVARKDNLLFIIKVLNNVDAISQDVANELLSVAKYLEGVPIVIGRRSSFSILDDDVVYFRHGVPIMTYETLKNYLQGMPPVICAAPGGFYVNIDGEQLRQMRMEQGISIGQLARVAGVSRRAIRMYEDGERATIEVAEKMAEFLGDDFIKPIDLMKVVEKEEIEIKEIENEIFSILEEIGAFVLPTTRSPFHAIGEVIKERFIVGINERRIKEKARLVFNLSKVVEKHSVLFLESCTKKNIEGVPVIEKDELKRIDEPEKLIELILERK